MAIKRKEIPLYVLNNFIKFEKKVYQVFGLPLGRPLRVKSILYAIAIGIIEIIIYFTPIIGNLINWLPLGILILIPIGSAWLLSDIGTEGRSPVSFFKSFITFHLRKLKGETYFRNRTVQKPSEYQFNNYITVTDQKNERKKDKGLYNAKKDQQKALRYMERIKDPDGFFEKLDRGKENQKKGFLNINWKKIFSFN